MEWYHKNVKIFIECDGYFYFKHNNDAIATHSLEEAKNKIDELTKEYYTFTKTDFSKMFKKLDNREKEFVKSLIEEIHCHERSAYCSIGISNDMPFNFDAYE